MAYLSGSLFPLFSHGEMVQHFAWGLAPAPHIAIPAAPPPVLLNPVPRNYYEPWRHQVAVARDFDSNIKMDKKNFLAHLPGSLFPLFSHGEMDHPHIHAPARAQHFAWGLAPAPLIAYISAAPPPVLLKPVPRNYYEPWRHQAAVARDFDFNIKMDKKNFQINLDVQHFAPDEISVKTADGFIIIEGKHEEKRDEHGYVSRQFTRRYALPEGCVPESVESKLSSDGVLTITAPRVAMPAGEGGRNVPITETGPVRKEIKEPQADGDKA